MKKEAKNLLQKMESHLRQIVVLASVSNLSLLRDFESDDDFGRISNVVKKLIASEQAPSDQAVPDEHITKVIDVLRKEKIQGFLRVIRCSDESVVRKLMDERGITTKLTLDDVEYNISGRSLEKLKRLQRIFAKENRYVVIVGLKERALLGNIKLYQVHKDDIKKRSVGRPEERDKQFLYVSLLHILFDIYISVAWTKKVRKIKGWRTLVNSAIENALQEWLKEHSVKVGVSETRFKDFVRKLRLICRQEILITFRTPRPDKELKDQILKSSLGLYLRGYYTFQSSPLISINCLYRRIIKDIEENGVSTIGEFDWYRVDIPAPGTEEFFLRKQLDEMQLIYDEVYQAYLELGYSVEDAHSEAEQEANDLFKE